MIYQRHAGKASHSDLHIVGLLVQPAYMLSVDRYIFHLPLGLGPTFFGHGSLSDEIGLMWRLEPGFFVRLNEYLALGVEVGPGGVVLLNRSAASWFVSTGAVLVGIW